MVREELSELLREQHTSISESVVQSLRSGAVTPAGLVAGPGGAAASPDPAVQQAHIRNLLQQGQLNEAFQLVRAYLPGLKADCEEIKIQDHPHVSPNLALDFCF